MEPVVKQRNNVGVTTNRFFLCLFQLETVHMMCCCAAALACSQAVKCKLAARLLYRL